jgi:hypothetical protein
MIKVTLPVTSDWAIQTVLFFGLLLASFPEQQPIFGFKNKWFLQRGGQYAYI